MKDQLSRYNKNFRYECSQCGEDGIIKEIFNRIGTTTKLCVEFGAYNGREASNTWHLWHNEGWQALLIEGSAKAMPMLHAETEGYNVIALQKYISISGYNSIDNVFEKHFHNKTIDLMSIDVDGDDYYILNSISKHLPRVMVIEYNPTIPPHVEFVQDQRECFGSSALSICKVAASKGYRIAAMTIANLIFVLDSEYHKLEIEEPRLIDIFPYDQGLTYIISSFDHQAYINKAAFYPPRTHPYFFIKTLIHKGEDRIKNKEKWKRINIL